MNNSDRVKSLEFLFSYLNSSGNTEIKSGIQKITFPELLEELLKYHPRNITEEKRRYFIPEAEDFTVPYTCQILTKSGWLSCILYSQVVFNNERAKGNIKTSYLTEEQVLKEGWIKKEGTNYFCKNNHYSCHFGQSIHEKGLYSHLHVYHEFCKLTLYSGSCRSINEFRTIMKLLNIK